VIMIMKVNKIDFALILCFK